MIVRLLGSILIAACAASAQCLDTEDVYEMSKAGVCDEVLLALVRADGAGAIDTGQVLDLQRLGVSDAVVSELMRIDSARHDPDVGIATVVVVNRSGRPLWIGGRAAVELSTIAGAVGTLRDGDEVLRLHQGHRLDVRLDGRPTGLSLDPVNGTRIELLADGDRLRARVTRDGLALFDGPLVLPRREARVAPPAGRIDRDGWDPSQCQVFWCSAHPECWSRVPGKCPICGTDMQLVK